MRRIEIFPGVSMDPNIRFGKPYIKGTRVDVATVLDNLAAGESWETIQEEYGLTREQIVSALRYAAHVARCRELANMAADSAIQSELQEINEEFSVTEADGLESKSLRRVRRGVNDSDSGQVCDVGVE